jgi:phage shock protein E
LLWIRGISNKHRNKMDWTVLGILAVVVVVIVVWKRMSQVSAEAARKYLAQGALVVDVRSSGEFRGGHLPDAVNIPLDELREAMPRQVADKSRVLLLHCLSGTRSGIAVGQLKRMGYSNVFNLGSLHRASAIMKRALS